MVQLDFTYYLVGGAVRDRLLQRPQTDRDFVVIGQTPQAMIQRGFKPVGKSFPVFLHPATQEEYALARTEKKVDTGHDGFVCIADPSVSLIDDLRRRDLTINAMAQDASGHIVDPYGGLQDLKQGWLRHVSEAFVEDPLRILRVARFAARLPQFKVHDQTMQLMQHMVATDELKSLSGERLWQELSRALLEVQPKHFFTTLHSCGALSKLGWNIFNLKQLDMLSKLPSNLAIRWSWLSMDTSLAELEQCHQQLKSPKSCIKLSQLVCRLQHLVPQINQPINGLKLWYQLDPMRAPDQLEAWVSIMQLKYPQPPYSQYLKRFYYVAHRLMQQPIPKTITQLSCGRTIKEKIFAYRLSNYPVYWEQSDIS